MRRLLVTTVLLLAGRALAEPVDLPLLGESSFDVTATAITEYHGDNHDDSGAEPLGPTDVYGRHNDDYLVEILRLNLSLTHGETAAGLRLDGTFFQDVDVLDDSDTGEPYPGIRRRDCTSRCIEGGVDAGTCSELCARAAYLEDDIRPERIWARTRVGPVRLTAGDFPARFGNGLALSARTLDELNWDSSIRGGRVDLETDAGFTVSALAGQTNIQNLDALSLAIVDDPIDFVAGLRVEQTLPSGLSGGVHYVGYDYRLSSSSTYPAVGPNDEGAHVVGASIRAPAVGGVLDLVLEADHLTYVSLVPGAGQEAIVPPVLVEGPGIREKSGFALYGSANLTAGDTTILVEGKDYSDYRLMPDMNRPHIVYAEPPTLEREDQQIVNNFNTLAARVRVEHRLPDVGTTFFTNYLVASYAAMGEDRLGSTAIAAHHAFGGVEQRWDGGEFVVVSTGVREESFLEPRDVPGRTLDDGTVFQFPHAEIQTGFPIAGPHAIELNAWTWFETKVDHDFTRASASLTYSIAPSWTFAVIYGHTSEKREELQPRDYLAGQIGWLVTDVVTLRAFAGSRMGGILCVGGVCRDYPPFEGGQVTVLVRY